MGHIRDDMVTLEYCNECIDGNCPDHEWFTNYDPKTKKDVLITFLKHLLEDLPQVFEKVYLTETVTSDCYERIIVGGKLTFDFDNPTVHMKDGKYIPLKSYTFSDNIVRYGLTIEVDLVRHHPTDLVIKKNMFLDEEIYRFHIIYFGDNLHCESISDYQEIVDSAARRLNEFINKLEDGNDIKIKV